MAETEYEAGGDAALRLQGGAGVAVLKDLMTEAASTSFKFALSHGHLPPEV